MRLCQHQTLSLRFGHGVVELFRRVNPQLNCLVGIFEGGGLKNLGVAKDPSTAGDSKAGEADPWQRLQSRAAVVVIDVARDGTDNLVLWDVGEY